MIVEPGAERSAEAGASARLVADLATGTPPGGALEALVFARVPAELSVAAAERPIEVDQTNRSVVVGERVVVKWIRDAQRGRAPEFCGHLVEVGFTRMPPAYAALLSPSGGLVALVTGYLPDAVDGWDWCVEALLAELAGGAPADFATEVGALVAELHAALATASSRWPQPVSTVEAPASGAAGETLDAALAAVEPGEDAGWLAAHAPRMRAELAAGGAAVPTTALRVHGDLHVGQVLRWRDGYAITDFDGNPTVADAPRHEPAARDVAQMCTSLGHVGQIANRLTGGRHLARILDWAQESRAAFLAGYRAGLAGRGLGSLFDERLLRPFEIEQECRELIYAARFLPRWRYAPMGVLRAWYP